MGGSEMAWVSLLFWAAPLAVAVVAVRWMLAATRRAKALADSDEGYRQLAKDVAATQRQTVELLAGLQNRIDGIEKILSDVS
jgi:cytochrome c-type biogenesis protein CcmH/NrfF